MCKHKTSLNKYQETEIIMFFDHSGIKLENSNKRYLKNPPQFTKYNIPKLNKSQRRNNKEYHKIL